MSLTTTFRRPVTVGTTNMLTAAVNRVDDIGSVVVWCVGDVLFAYKMQDVRLTIPASRLYKLVELADLSDWFSSSDISTLPVS